MTSQTHHPWKILSTTAQLAFLGTVGITVLGLFIGLVAMSIGFIALAGIGLVMLAGVIYVMHGFGWWETARVAGLYHLEVPLPRFATNPERTFGGWVRSLGRQLRNGRMWRALASLTIASIIGAVQSLAIAVTLWALTMVLATLTGWGHGLIPAAFSGSTGVAGLVLIMLLSVAIVVAIALIHRTLTMALIRGGAREDELLAEARASHAQRAGAVRAADVERTRIERDLHDGVQPRLVSVAMTLGLARETIDSDPRGAKALITEAHTSTKAAITELRTLARGIHTSVLDDRGLDAALSALAGRSHIPVQLDVDIPVRCSRDAEAAVYFVVAEALTNAAKHSRAAQCQVRVRYLPGPAPSLLASIEDDGIGAARILPGGGLDGLSNRVLAAGGTFNLTSPAGGPTTIEVSVPCAS